MDLSTTLSDEQIGEVQRLAALGYSPAKMALYLDIDKVGFVEAALNVNSYIYYNIERGKLLSAAREQMALLEAAESGKVQESQQLDKIRRSRGWQISKLDIFGGFEDKHLLQKLEDYIQSGSISNLSAEEAIYVEFLTLISSMSRKYGRRNTILFFTKEPFNLKYALASERYDEAINLFYRDRNVEKKSLRHLRAEQLEEAATIVRDNAITSRDWEVYGNLLMQASKLQELDKPDPDKLPKEVYSKPVRVYSLDPEFIGLPKTDRQLIANQIEQLDIPERDKIRLRKDGGLDQILIQETLDDIQDESQSA